MSGLVDRLRDPRAGWELRALVDHAEGRPLEEPARGFLEALEWITSDGTILDDGRAALVAGGRPDLASVAMLRETGGQ